MNIEPRYDFNANLGNAPRPELHLMPAKVSDEQKAKAIAIAESFTYLMTQLVERKVSTELGYVYRALDAIVVKHCPFVNDPQAKETAFDIFDEAFQCYERVFPYILEEARGVYAKSSHYQDIDPATGEVIPKN
jgi:hypothetical protein